MSLTKFLGLKDVKQKFLEFFPKPNFMIKKEIKATLLALNAAEAGTAFDYLLRFYIEHLNSEKVIPREWVAETTLKLLMKAEKEERLIVLNGSLEIAEEINDVPVSFIYKNRELKKNLCQTANTIISEAKHNYNSYLTSGSIEQELITSTLKLAQLDEIFRSHFISKDLGIVNDNAVKDLSNLITIVDPNLFRAKKYCFLNPTFGEGSRLVGGADADLIIDDILIDIKTVKNLEMKRETFNQLIGYYTLYKIGGIDHSPTQIEINRLGVYFSRFGYLLEYKIEDIIDGNIFPDFKEWFVKRALKYSKM